MIWKLLHPDMTQEALGFIPAFLNDDDPLPAREQIDRNYGFAGGWDPMSGFTMQPDGTLEYPGDPPLPPLAETTLHGTEVIRVYLHSWVAITQPDGSFEVCRMD